MHDYKRLPMLMDSLPRDSYESCCRLLDTNWDLFHRAPGASFNHHNWVGGYIDHITETMNLFYMFYHQLAVTGRLAQLPEDEQFTLGDGLLVMFLHDLEKPWRFVIRDGQPVIDANGRIQVRPGLDTKEDRKRFADQKILQYGIKLTPYQRHALDFVEGIRDHQYSPHDRVMRPLAALCHASDMLSARLFYGFPLAVGDAWAPSRAHRRYVQRG